jgi:hypothetical protein
MSASKNPEKNETSSILSIGDEILLSIMELLSIPNVLSCTLVSMSEEMGLKTHSDPLDLDLGQ